MVYYPLISSLGLHQPQISNTNNWLKFGHHGQNLILQQPTFYLKFVNTCYSAKLKVINWTPIYTRSPFTGGGGGWIYGITWKHVYFNIFILVIVDNTSVLKLVFPITYCCCLDSHLSGCVVVVIIVVVVVIIVVMSWQSLEWLHCCPNCGCCCFFFCYCNYLCCITAIHIFW